MSWTKRQLVVQAYTELGLANYVFDLEPEQLQNACNVMDAMIASWSGVGAQIAYPASTSPGTTDLDADSTIPDFCNAAVYLGLALRLAPSMGKNPPQMTMIAAKQAYLNMLTMLTATPNEMSYPSTLPKGQGNKVWRGIDNPYFEADSPILGSDPTSIDLGLN